MNLSMFMLFGVVEIFFVVFNIIIMRKGQLRLMHKIFFINSAAIIIWILALMSLYFLSGNATAEYIIDSISNLVLYMPTFSLLITFAFVNGWEKLPKWSSILLVIPTISFILVWTNPLHHLYYKNLVFTLKYEELEFGPFFYFSGVYAYVCSIVALAWIVRFAVNSKRSIHAKQAAFFAMGIVIALSTNMMATLGVFGSLNLTPLGFVAGFGIIDGIAIFKFRMFDIRPIAVETVLERISDGYLVLSNDGVVVNCNRSFSDTFGAVYGLAINSNIQDFVSAGDISDNIGMHTLISTMKSCEDSQATISYEQSITICNDNDDDVSLRFYLVDVTGLKVGDRNVGFVVFFKDITSLKESMRKLNNSQQRLMQQERLVFLGQMAGGVSHNLKTPIMSVSGSIKAIEKLIDEASVSMDDPDVSAEDYKEIYGDVKKWISRIQEACAYMSDIISAIKGQATNLSSVSDREFTMDEVMKRVKLLLRHELQTNGCLLKINDLVGSPVKITGDINSMVQVINNMASNSIDAMKETGGNVEVEFNKDEKNYIIKVKDKGPGVSEEVRKQLFKNMITSKGAMGSGLGIYVSNIFIKARFDGTIHYEKNTGGGAVFVISLPLNNVEIVA